MHHEDETPINIQLLKVTWNAYPLLVFRFKTVSSLSFQIWCIATTVVYKGRQFQKSIISVFFLITLTNTYLTIMANSTSERWPVCRINMYIPLSTKQTRQSGYLQHIMIRLIIIKRVVETKLCPLTVYTSYGYANDLINLMQI